MLIYFSSGKKKLDTALKIHRSILLAKMSSITMNLLGTHLISLSSCFLNIKGNSKTKYSDQQKTSNEKDI